MDPSPVTPIRPPTTLNDMPHDVLTIIASNLAALHTRGPPSAVYASLFRTCRSLADTGSAHLDNQVFRLQFDVDSLDRRFPGRVNPKVLSSELRRRWSSLKRIRWAASAGPSVWADPSLYAEPAIREDMWVAFMLLTENDGKNYEQLVGWAMLQAYIQAFIQWDLDPLADGDALPEETEIRSLGLWLIVFLSDDRNLTREIDRHPRLKRLLNPIAFGSFSYPTEHLPWYQFHITPADAALVTTPQPPGVNLPSPSYARISTFNSYLGKHLRVSPPLMSEAAIALTFKRITRGALTGSNLPSPPASEDGETIWDSRMYDLEWSRLVSFAPSPVEYILPPVGFKYVPGSFSGIFDGIFIVPGLEAHPNIRAGEPAISTFESTHFVRDDQAWHLNEYSFDRSSPGTIVEVNRPGYMHARRVHCRGPMTPASPLSAHLPESFVPEGVPGGLLAWTTQGASLYKTWQAPPPQISGPADDSEDEGTKNEDEIESELSVEEDGFIDIIVTGEAIEPLGGLRGPTLMLPGSVVQGTVRRKDGLITLCVIPAQDLSGEWIYIGRVSSEGTWYGRWRSRMDDATSIVPEGIFCLQRR